MALVTGIMYSASIGRWERGRENVWMMRRMKERGGKDEGKIEDEKRDASGKDS